MIWQHFNVTHASIQKIFGINVKIRCFAWELSVCTLTNPPDSLYSALLESWAEWYLPYSYHYWPFCPLKYIGWNWKLSLEIQVDYSITYSMFVTGPGKSEHVSIFYFINATYSYTWQNKTTNSCPCKMHSSQFRSCVTQEKRQSGSVNLWPLKGTFFIL